MTEKLTTNANKTLSVANDYIHNNKHKLDPFGPGCKDGGTIVKAPYECCSRIGVAITGHDVKCIDDSTRQPDGLPYLKQECKVDHEQTATLEKLKDTTNRFARLHLRGREGPAHASKFCIAVRDRVTCNAPHSKSDEFVFMRPAKATTKNEYNIFNVTHGKYCNVTGKDHSMSCTFGEEEAGRFLSMENLGSGRMIFAIEPHKDENKLWCRVEDAVIKCDTKHVNTKSGEFFVTL